MDYTDFIQQAEIDLKRAEDGFAEKDFAMSSFWCQQGFEKYLKAYFLKCGIFNNPVELRHSAYPKIISELLSHLSDPEIRDQDNIQLKSTLKFLNSLNEILIKIESDDRVKIMCWKGSLDIPFSKQETDIDAGLGQKIFPDLTSMMNETEVQFLSIAKLLTTIDFKKIDKSKLDDRTLELLDLLISITTNTLDITKLQNVDESFTQLQSDTSRMMELIGYGSGKGSISKEETKNISKTLNLVKSLNWISSGIQVYPHETISRYPIFIDGTLSTELYAEHSSKLQILIQNIRKSCDDIKQEIKQL